MYIHTRIYIYTHKLTHNGYISTNVHTYTHTHKHTHRHTQIHIIYKLHIYIYIYTTISIPVIHVCVTDPARCGTSQKCTKYTNLQCKIQEIFYKNRILNNL
jgi:hypothetical protein